jgi:hypothetical protein
VHLTATTFCLVNLNWPTFLPGHPLPEVRSRSLRSLKLKLEHGLLILNDVVEEEYMLRQLLEWFNKEGCQQEEEVLGLLIQLSQVKS